MAAPQLRGVDKPAVAALLMAKSTPFLITALVGMKGDHVAENLAVTALEILSRRDFARVMHVEFEGSRDADTDREDAEDADGNSET